MEKKNPNYYKGFCVILTLICFILGILWLQDNDSAKTEEGRLKGLNEGHTAKIDSLKLSMSEMIKDIRSLEEQLDSQPKIEVINVQVINQVNSVDTLNSGELFEFFTEFGTGDNQ